MAKIVGIGGVFVKARDPKALQRWYADVLGLTIADWGGAQLWNDGPRNYGVWSTFAADTKYFEPSTKDFMINLRVDDLDGMLARVRDKGGNVLDRREDTPDGKFGYVVDPDGTLIELFEPPALL